MIDKLQFKWFKSIETVEFEPGSVNVLIGANGSGKSNLLEAIGVLSAAVSGRVDDEALLRRGVRPGVPALFKCSFPDIKGPLNIHFGAWRQSASYEVSLFNPIKDSAQAWRYHTENLQKDSYRILGRSHRRKEKHNPEAGLAALKMVEMTDQDDALLVSDQSNAFISNIQKKRRWIYVDIVKRKEVNFQTQIDRSAVFADFFNIIIGNPGKFFGYNSHIDIAIIIRFI